MAGPAGAAVQPDERAVPVGLLLFMLGLHIVNQIDRQLVAVFAADIIRDLELSRSQFALIAGLAFSAVYAFAALFAGVLADRLGRVRSALLILLALAPLLLCYRLAPGGTALFLLGMIGSILFMTVLYGLIFAVIEELLPPRLKATSTGLNMLLINVFALGAVALGIGYASDRLAAAGSSLSWTWPLLGADLLALLAIPCAWLALRSPRQAAYRFTA